MDVLPNRAFALLQTPLYGAYEKREKLYTGTENF